LKDPAIGSLLITVLPGSPKVGLAKGRAALPAISKSEKPVAFSLMGEGAPISDELVAEMREHGIPLFRSPERAIRALAIITKYGRALAKSKHNRQQPAEVKPIPLPGKGVLPEYMGKKYLSDIGIPTPAGELAREVEDAVGIAQRIGYPVVLKIQSSELAHKSDIGGVIVGISNDSDMREAWTRLHRNVQHARPDVVPDGVLVEKMGDKGIEMVVGARRDPEWGPIVMVGLGGIYIEILKDVCFLPPNLGEDAIAEKILTLQTAALLRGARGAEPADVKALAKVVSLVGGFMNANPKISEIDINPLIVFPEGKGVLALDALVVVSES
jgi:acyl-CoA synthetase (NDP forming)